MDAGESYITRVGAVLRRFSIDELPQLVNVITGDMSLVGPRPALYSQTDLTAMRHAIGVDRLRPGVTGLAQVMGRDDLLLAEKVAYDAEYLERADAVTDLSVLARTVGAVLSQRGVR